MNDCMKCQYNVSHPFHDNGDINEQYGKNVWATDGLDAKCIGPDCENRVDFAGETCSYECYFWWHRAHPPTRGGYAIVPADEVVPLTAEAQPWYLGMIGTTWEEQR